MPIRDFSVFAALKPTRTADGKRSSVMLNVKGHAFQAVFMCLPTGALSDPAIHGSRADAMTPAQRVELEAEARFAALRIKEKHGIELLAGMSVVIIDDLLRCLADAPASPAAGVVHRLEDWDALTGADETPIPPFGRPVLSADEWDGVPAWLFWGTLDLQVEATPETQEQLEPELAARIGAKHVHVCSLWLGRPEVLAFFVPQARPD